MDGILGDINKNDLAIDEFIIEKDAEKAFYWLHRAIVQNQIRVSDPNLHRLALESTEEDTVFKTAIKSVGRSMNHITEWFESDGEQSGESNDSISSGEFESGSDKENIAFEEDEE